MSISKLLVFSLFLLSLIGCKGVGPLKFPEASNITSIQISEGLMDQSRLKHTITSPEKIADLISFVNNNNSGWYKTWHTYPTPEATAVINTSHSTQTFIWFGSNWAGSHSDPMSPKQVYLWGLSPEKLKQLKGMLNVSI